jgi:methionyl-tRNA formyltransferase
MTLNTALLFQGGNFVGREYYRALREAGRAPDLTIAVGGIAEASVAHEIARTGGRWNPPAIPAGETVHAFDSLADPALWTLIRERGIDIAIQGGLGILKPDMLAAPRIGFVNVHPGTLPAYRGNSCPEWALQEGAPITATAHLIDAGIDSGPVIHAGAMPLDPAWDYEDIRARLYRHCATVLIGALERLEARGPSCAVAQDESKANYREAMTEAMLETLKHSLRRKAEASAA